MFFFLPTALAAIVLGWPCQRLNWAWRNVWVTCSINAFVPVSTTPAVYGGGFTQLSSTGGAAAFSGPSALDTSGQFSPGSTSGPTICQNSPTTGGLFMRNRCRRMLDVYGNLVRLCGLGPAKSMAGPNSLTPDWAPQSGHQPHLVNVQQLGFIAQACITPGASFPTPSSTCPGLAGWFTVVWNACSFTSAPGVSTYASSPTSPSGVVFIPNYLTTSSSSAPWGLGTPSLFCGTSSGTPAGSPGIWNVKGPAFRSSRCRKALDQFGRTAFRCSPTATTPSATAFGMNDPLRFLASGFASTVSPFCSY